MWKKFRKKDVKCARKVFRNIKKKSLLYPWKSLVRNPVFVSDRHMRSYWKKSTKKSIWAKKVKIPPLENIWVKVLLLTVEDDGWRVFALSFCLQKRPNFVKVLLKSYVSDSEKAQLLHTVYLSPLFFFFLKKKQEIMCSENNLSNVSTKSMFNVFVSFILNFNWKLYITTLYNIVINFYYDYLEKEVLSVHLN